MLENINLEKPLKYKLSNLNDNLFTASLEIIFSSFGLVQFKMHNRLGNKQARQA